jgi:hypothetical protein
MRAPDYVEPFEAWRVWNVLRRNGEYVLASVVQRAVWQAREEFTAQCLRSRGLFGRVRRRAVHEAPEVYCECGIYGTVLDRLDYYLAETPFRGAASVLGTVALWGTVIECEHGFRASHAYPLRLYVPADAGRPWRIGWDEVAVGLWGYGVPVEPLAARASEATRFLADRQAA